MSANEDEIPSPAEADWDNEAASEQGNAGEDTADDASADYGGDKD